MFWEIKKICIVDRNVKDIMFIVSKVVTVRFNEHFQCYEVVPPPTISLKVGFACCLPLNQTKPKGIRTRSKFVCLRYEIDSTN